MKRFLIILLALLPMVWCANRAYAKANPQQVLFYVDIHCQGCIDKIMHNIAYEKGVRDIQCNLEKKTVLVTYDANKTDVPTLQKAFAKIGKPATTAPVEPCETPQKDTHTVDAQSGASTHK